jgi:flagellin
MVAVGSESSHSGKMPGISKNKDYPMISLMTNVDSLMAQQNLTVNSQFQSNAINQLTSGYRINSSADDAAGLSVANGYRNQIAELNQGVLNANQGVSQLQIVDGGLSNISQMLDRLQTLATESASQTFTGNRNTLQTEYSGLLTEIGRQADNVGLGDNNTANSKNLQVYIGGGQSSDANSSVGVNLLGASVSAAGLGLAGTSVLTNDPVVVGTAGTAATAIAAGNTDTFTVNTGTQDTLSITITGKAGDTVQGQVGELNQQLSSAGITASLNGQGVLQFQSGSAFSVSAIANTAADLVSTTAAATENLGLYNAGYTTPTKAGGDVLTVAEGSVTASITLGASDYSAGGTQNQVNEINQGLVAQGITDVTAVADAATGGNISLQGNNSFTLGITQGATVPAGAVTSTTAATTSGGGASDPTAAINAITAAIQSLGAVQGVVGAGENKLNYAISLATSQITSFSSAQSQIRDANVAQEAANLSQAQVIQQASIAAMAQANSEPQAILKLLQNM